MIAELTLTIYDRSRDDLDNIKQGRRGCGVANLLLSHWPQFRSSDETPDNRPIGAILSLDSPFHFLEIVRKDWCLEIHVVWSLRCERNIQTIQGSVYCKKIFTDEMINKRGGKKETIQ